MSAERVLMMGNEAIARGAIEAGMDLFAGYPGTPASEVGEALAIQAKEFDGYYVEWSTNEKVGFEIAAGASLVGARALTAMKTAGLNVAMDTFMTLVYGGIKGGMVVVVADDPCAHYSSNEQDSRFCAMYAEIPCLEPKNQDEARIMTRDAFNLSEHLKLPVFLRSVARLSHASGDVELGGVPERARKTGFNKHYDLPYRWNVYGPPGCLKKHEWLHGRLPLAQAFAEETEWNVLTLQDGAPIGIIAAGIGACYTKEALCALGVKANLLEIGVAYPIPTQKVRRLLESSPKVLFIEEGEAFVETQVRSYAQNAGISIPMYGKKYDAVLEPLGEINSSIAKQAVATVLKMALPSSEARKEKKAARESLVTPRSSTLCAGCSHLGNYWALKEALRKYPGVHIVNGDIGCYEQGGYGIFSQEIKPSLEDSKKYPVRSPYEILDTIYVMGSGIGMGQGQCKAGYVDGKVVAVAGDSTFIHATLPAIVNMTYNDSDMTFIVLANCWTAMTGHQPNPTTGRNAVGNESRVVDIEEMARSMGIEDVRTASSYDVAAATEAISGALGHSGPSVVILTGECQLQRLKRLGKPKSVNTKVTEDACTGCKNCLALGCPAIGFDSEKKKAYIDDTLCVDCGLCISVCPKNAIGEGI